MERTFADLTLEERRAVWSNLNAGNYFLFTGSGVSLDSSGEQGPMLSAAHLNEKLKSINDLGANSSLQQNYSLLSDEEIEDHLTLPYSCVAPGPTISALSNLPWRRVYTLNIDNAFEVSSRNIAKSGGYLSR